MIEISIINTNNTDILKATTVEDTSNTDNIYSAINLMLLTL